MDKKDLLDPRDYVRFWFKKAQKSAKNAVETPNLFGSLYLDYDGIIRIYNSKHKQKPIRAVKRDLLQAAFNEFVDQQIKEERKQALTAFNCETPNLNPILTWVRAVTGREDERDGAIMAHWLWMVKRKAAQSSIKNSVMPILFGPQGGGKSVALNQLIKPLVIFKMNMRMTQLSDERVFEGMANNLIVLFDELQGIERADLNSLKNQITTEMNTYRKLHSHAVVNVPMSCSFIGATNKPLNESFSDSTGMRRFYEIKTSDKIDWTVINNIDYNELWKGIDERLEDGYLTGVILTEVLSAQKNLVNKELIDVFISEFNIKPDGDNTKTVKAKSIYQSYQRWCIENGVKTVLDYEWFNRRLLNKKLVSTLKRNDKKRNERFYDINADCEIGVEPEMLGSLIKFNKG